MLSIDATSSSIGLTSRKLFRFEFLINVKKCEISMIKRAQKCSNYTSIDSIFQELQLYGLLFSVRFSNQILQIKAFFYEIITILSALFSGVAVCFKQTNLQIEALKEICKTMTSALWELQPIGSNRTCKKLDK